MKDLINRVRKGILHALTSSVEAKVSLKDIETLRIHSIQRVLIVRPNSRLGNQLLITPLIQEIGHQYPDCKIDIISRGGLMPILLKNYTNIGHIIMLPGKPFKQLLKYMKVWLSVRKYEYDITINIVEESSSGRLLTRLSKSKIKIFNTTNIELADQRSDYQHMAKNSVYNLRNILQKTGLNIEQKSIPSLSIQLNDNELENGKKTLKDIFANDKPILAFYTFATGEKCYSKEWWQEVYHNLKESYADRYNLLEVLPKENISQIDFQEVTYYSTDLREMCATLANCDIFITADCGIMHLASSSGVPTIGIFSRNNVEKYQPYNTNSVGVYSQTTSIATLLQVIANTLALKAAERVMFENMTEARLNTENLIEDNMKLDLNDFV